LAGILGALLSEASSFRWIALSGQIVGAVCLIVVLRIFARANAQPKFADIEWDTVQEQAMFSMHRVIQRVRGKHLECVTRTGRTDSVAKDQVFFFATFAAPGEPDDAVCLGVTYRSAARGTRAECLIDISGEMSGKIWAELSAELIEASTSETVRAIASTLTATELVANRVEEAMDELFESVGAIR